MTGQTLSALLLTRFAPPPSADERPPRLNDPFDPAPPPALARRAAEQLMARLAAGELAPGIPTSTLTGADRGKMFGVLVVETAEGEVGFLKAFSGQLHAVWDAAGYVGPAFDRGAREAVLPQGEKAVRELTVRVDAARDSIEASAARHALARLIADQQRREAGLRQRHRFEREARRTARSEAASDRQALDAQSRSSEVELRAIKTLFRQERSPLEQSLRRFERRHKALQRLRRIVSRRVSWQHFDSYQFENAAGERKSLRQLFAPRMPPSGAGDCAAPKLLVCARRHGLRPLAIAEFWWGTSPPGIPRLNGHYYPACSEKCGPILRFLLGGA